MHAGGTIAGWLGFVALCVAFLGVLAIFDGWLDRAVDFLVSGDEEGEGEQ
jgi:hypothetical protein